MTRKPKFKVGQIVVWIHSRTIMPGGYPALVQEVFESENPQHYTYRVSGAQREGGWFEHSFRKLNKKEIGD
jgi:hypothetical protein